MKTGKLIMIGTIVALVSFLVSCDEDETSLDPNESFFINNILLGSNSAISHARSSGFGGPIGAIYGNMTSSYYAARGIQSPSRLFQKLTNGRIADDTTTTDSADVVLPECIIETWTDDGNGNYTYSVDFGTGCWHYGTFMFGKMEEKGHYSDNGFSSTTRYYHFGGSADEGGEDWSIDGKQHYSGTWEEVKRDNEEDTVWMFHSSYNFYSDLTQRYIDYGYLEDSSKASTGEQIITMEYEATGSEEMDHLGYTVKTRNESMEMDNGDAFHSTVATPLFYDYSCTDTWIAVRGVEKGDYKSGKNSGTYKVDYGDGTCDNIITVTENGATTDVDLGDIWFGWCGTQ
ncbi:MAG: hypothetical protein Tsb0034_01340 [Ekhidna sp.]